MIRRPMIRHLGPSFSRLALAAGIVLAGCERTTSEPAPEPLAPEISFRQISFSELPGWQDDEVAAALPALRRSCRRLVGLDDERSLGPDGLAGRVADWRAPCADLYTLSDADHAAARDRLEAHFVPFAIDAPASPDGLFTGYYEAELKGARQPDARYRWPLYGKPKDMVTVDLGQFRADLEGERLVGRVEGDKLVPYHARAEIDGGGLDGQAEPLLWVDDPVDAFVLHIQGSGRVLLPDGAVQRVGFAASNGHPFTAVGRVLIEEDRLPAAGASMQAIRAWMRENPDEGRELMQRNARYIFFRAIDGEGPIGAQGVALTPGRSLAVDPAYLPLGAPIWLDTSWPGSDKPLRRLMVSQDTGSAIKGPLRGDFYWGSGEQALAWAGRMKQAGRPYLLLPRAVAERRGPTS